MKKIFRFLLACVLIVAVPGFAKSNNQKETVNILTWWGYLSYPDIIKQVENQCNVKLSFDEYYSNDEFIRRWESHSELYDIIIFSSTIYDLLRDKIPRINNSKLSAYSTQYHPVIRAHYLSMHYPRNIVYFMHAMSGFLWNPDNISISEQDTIQSIFKKATNKLVVMMDDPVEVKRLVEADGASGLTPENFENIAQRANVYITNNYSQIYKKTAFSFSYSWSGEAVIDIMAANKKYQFLVHPKLSYISSDLLAQTSRKTSAECVARIMASRDISTIIQNADFYFTPYIDYKNVIDDNFKKLYLDFIAYLSHALWVDSVRESHFQEINKEWQLIKISLNNRKRGENNEFEN